MRVLFFGNAAYGHIVPQLPLARAFRDRGDAVAFVTAPSLERLLRPEAMPLLAAGPELPELVAEVQWATGVNLLTAPSTAETAGHAFGASRIDLAYEDSLDVAREWKPDLIVAEELDFVGPMVGTELDVPVASLAFGPAVWPELGAAARIRAAVRYAARGLQFEWPRWHLDTSPRSLQSADWQAPANRIGLRAEAYSGGERIPATFGSRHRPRVLVTFGTLFVVPEIIDPLVRELLRHDVDIRVTLGPTKTPADFDLDSARVEFVGFTPLAQLLSDVDVVLTVGGAGTILGSLAHGIPLVMTPLGADQPMYSERAEAAGVGIAFPLGRPDPRAVGKAVVTVLNVPDYQHAATRTAAEIAAMPTPNEVATRLAADLS